MLDRIATKTEMAQLKYTVPTVGDRIGIDTWEDISLSSSSAPRTEEYKSLPITIKKYESLLTQQLKRVGKCDYFIGPGEAAVLRSKKRNHGRGARVRPRLPSANLYRWCTEGGWFVEAGDGPRRE